MKLIQRNFGAVVGGFARLSSSRFLEDTRIVCQDGVVMANALMLSQWSEVVRLYMKEYGLVMGLQGNPTTLLLPEVQSSTMRKLLAWSATGQVVVTTREMVEATTTLAALGAKIRFSHELVSSAGGSNDDSGVEIEQEVPSDNVGREEGLAACDVIIRDGDAKEIQAPKRIKRKSIAGPKSRKRKQMDTTTNERPAEKRRKEDFSPDSIQVEFTPSAEPEKADFSFDYDPVTEPVSDDFSPRIENYEGAKGSAKKELGCLLCPFKTTQGCAILIAHLSSNHYREDLLRLVSDPAAPCPLCHRSISQRESFARHLAAFHGKIYAVASPEVREHLRELRFSNVMTQDWMGQSWVDCVERFSETYPDCSVCASDFPIPTTMKMHQAHDHHSDALMEHFDSNKGVCRVCQQPVDSSNGGQIFSAVHHMSKSHPDLLFDLMPSECAKVMSQIQNRTKENRRDRRKKPTAASSSGKPKIKATRPPPPLAKKTPVSLLKKPSSAKSSRPSNKPKPAQKKRSFSCPLCGNDYTTVRQLEHHLCRTHFKVTLVEHLGPSPSQRTCEECGVQVGTDTTVKNEFKRAMACHLGMNHRHLDKYLPVGLKAQIDEMRRLCSRRDDDAHDMRDGHFLDVGGGVAQEEAVSAVDKTMEKAQEESAPVKKEKVKMIKLLKQESPDMDIVENSVSQM